MTSATQDIEEKPLTTILPGGKISTLNFKEIWLFRDLLLTLSLRDVKLRYRQTALGAVWVILQPLLAAGIMTIVFSSVAGFKSPGRVPYILITLTGGVCWGLFNNILGRSSTCMVSNAALVSKVYFPRMILPCSTVTSSLVDLLVSSIMIITFMIIYHIGPGWGLLLLPVWLIILAMLALGFGLWASALMVSYRDVQYVVPVMMNLLMYASPVNYTVAMIQQRHSEKLLLFFQVNPLTELLEACRWSILGVGHLNYGLLLYSFVWAVAALLFGSFTFKRMERKFADVI